ncbi:MAG: NTP transferase domain-containing protein [Clostridiales bacterium]|nr:NTP transferase domain-containing protein [Clostridiales bacterium]
MQALILAAGMGKRLKDLTANNAKCMVKVGNETLIERAVKILDKKQLKRIIVVLGYEGEKLKNYIQQLDIISPLEFIDNPIYATTNNIYSFWLAKEFMQQDDTILLESDLIFEESVIDALMQDQRPSLALVDKRESWMDGTCVTLDSSDHILELIPGKKLDYRGKDQYYKTVNIYKFSQVFMKETYLPFLKAYMSAMGRNVYYETVLGLIIQLNGCELRAKRLEGQVWYEIDDVQDLHIAESLFEPDPEKKYQYIIDRRGGNWRYPKLIDYTFPYNSYYPTKGLMEEITSNGMDLLSSPPSDITYVRELLGKYYGIRENYMRAVRNIWAIEDILKADGILYTILDDPIGMKKIFRTSHKVQTILTQARVQGEIVLVDESVLEAVLPERMDSFLTNELLEQYRDVLIVYKDLGRAYSMPGLSVFMAAGAGEKIQTLLDRIETDCISSFAEFYLQIAEKYKGELQDAVLRMRKDYEAFIEGLLAVSYIRSCDGLADYIVCQLDEKLDCKALLVYLLQNNLLVSELSDVSGNETHYIGLAVRTETENQYLLSKLLEYEKRK